MLSVHTIAAGGGSLCRFDGVRLTVGPESAGARPGPLCYGLRDTSGARLARRARPHRRRRLPRPPAAGSLPASSRSRSRRRGARAHGSPSSPQRATTTAPKASPRASSRSRTRAWPRRSARCRCSAASTPGSSPSSASGAPPASTRRRWRAASAFARCCSIPSPGCSRPTGSAWPSWPSTPAPTRGACPSSAARAPAAASALLARLEAEGRAALAGEGADPDRVRAERFLDLRYVGSDAALSVPAPPGSDLGAAFAAAHRARYGYERPGRGVEVVTARVRVRAPEAGPAPQLPPPRGARGERRGARRLARTFFAGTGWCEAPVFWREDLAPAAELAGPALVLEETGTVVIEPGFRARLSPRGTLVLRDLASPARPRGTGALRTIPCASPSRAAASCRSPSAWAPCSATPRCRRTSRTGATTRAPCSTPRARSSPTRPTSRCTSARWARRCERSARHSPAWSPATCW